MRSRFSISALRSFNSKMVRLKEQKENIYLIAFIMFQFQNGSIKSNNENIYRQSVFVSIPKWFD